MAEKGIDIERRVERLLAQLGVQPRGTAGTASERGEKREIAAPSTKRRVG